MKNNVKEYRAKLFIEFCNANNINYKSESVEKHYSEFKEWIISMNKIKKDYINLLLSVNSNPGLTVELEKGMLNSLVPLLKKEGEEAVAITPYAETFVNMDIEKYDGTIVFGPYFKPAIKYSRTYPNSVLPSLKASENERQIETLITQIPVCPKILDPMMLSYSQINQVIFGVYGHMSDINKAKRISELKDLKQTLTDFYYIPCEEASEEHNGIYTHIIVANKKTLKKRN